MLWPKKIHTRNLVTKKNSCGSKIPPPPTPHNFSNGPSLIYDGPDKQTHLITSNVNRLLSDSNPSQKDL